MGTITGIISIISAVIQLVKLFGLLKTQKLLSDIHSGTQEMANAKTPEAKSEAAKNMVGILSRL